MTAGQALLLAALESSDYPPTTRQLVMKVQGVSPHWTYDAAYASLMRLKKRGLVSRHDRPARWELTAAGREWDCHGSDR